VFVQSCCSCCFVTAVTDFDFCGNVLAACGKTGGQQGDPFEIIVVLSDISLVLKEDAGLDLNDKTKISDNGDTLYGIILCR
jgi:hypothetical protein